jgi:hypothetical protein
MVTPVPLPVMVLPNSPDWLPFSQPVKVPSSNPASGKESAWTGAEKPKIDTNKRNTEGTAIINAGLLTRRRRTNMVPPLKEPPILPFRNY